LEQFYRGTNRPFHKPTPAKTFLRRRKLRVDGGGGVSVNTRHFCWGCGKQTHSQTVIGFGLPSWNHFSFYGEAEFQQNAGSAEANFAN
jgi:hypothetical protein